MAMRKALILALLACSAVLILIAGCAPVGAVGAADEPAAYSKSCEAQAEARADQEGSTARLDIQETSSERERKLVENLRDGGYVVLFRYAEGRHTKGLSSENRAQARDVGQTLCDLGASVGRIVSSPGVQARGAAEVAFGRDGVIIDRALVLPPGVPGMGDLEPSLRRLLSTSPPAGENIVVFASVIDEVDASGGEAVILKPAGNGDFQRVGLLSPEQWTGLYQSRS